MSKRKDDTLTKHHLIPRSRGGSGTDGNVRLVPYALHMAFHKVFGNLMPVECIVRLMDEWMPEGYIKQINIELGDGKSITLHPKSPAKKRKRRRKR